MTRIPDDKNPYSAKTPFDILGVNTSADARQLRDAQNSKISDLRDLRDRGKLTEQEYFDQREAINDAYNALKGKGRFAVEIFFFDSELGTEQCQGIAKQMRVLDFDFNSILREEGGFFRSEPAVPNLDKTMHDIAPSLCTALKEKPPESEEDKAGGVLAAIQFDV